MARLSPRAKHRTFARPEELPALRAERTARALSERLAVRPLSGFPFAVLEVRNPVHRTQYRIGLPAYPDLEIRFCSCEDFARRDLGTCKHIEAALIWLRENSGTPSISAQHSSSPTRLESIWARIDRAIRTQRGLPAVSATGLRGPGAILFGAAGRT